ncbi:ParB/RepB/Spo0J family partition protein [Salipiger thiooxidans]|uniref:ParB/RepB/Spo0J family partition protein n=1 Tax=Salipiger thiooxidans TaxID=282683 RepID=UPI001A8C1524|nr:ParB/RepB/Spo0J family partition protein [Salipiger thiooxidans]MBN8189797.1 ParB/RepB/Spo0J family partition protein [Salipiger thiooxidans]
MARRPSVFDRALPREQPSPNEAAESAAPPVDRSQAAGKVGIASLMSAGLDQATGDKGVPPTPAVMAMKRSLKDLSEASIQEIPLDQIGDSRIHDRIDLTEELEPLMKSLEENGQETAVKVRYAAPGPSNPVYEIIVGRRRVAAARALGWESIKGLVLKITDEELLRSLISENSARKDTTFIGRSQLAYLASKSGHSDEEIAKIYNSDRSLINRMIRIYEGIGPEIIGRIGDAPDIGRRRWMDLRSLLEENPVSPDEVSKLITQGIDRFADEISDLWEKRVSTSSSGNESIPQSTMRFNALERMLQDLKGQVSEDADSGTDASEGAKPTRTPGRVQKRPLPGFGTVQRKPKELVLKIDRGLDPDLLQRIEDALPDFVKQVMEDAQADKNS